MTLRVYNTLTRQKELFEPVEPGEVGIYLCGPTVYRPAHIGHAVGPVIFDVVKRYLRHKGYRVRWVVNVTDVEDKIMAEAAARGGGVSELARTLERQYVDALSRLGVKAIDELPRASEYIPAMIEHISGLIERGFAYEQDGDVYFDVSRDPDYGKLSNRRPEEQFAGTRSGLVSRSKRNPGDFALWKAAKPGEPEEMRFDSPWGPGRPGWHIECSVMSAKLLGETLDIHGGGMDLIFPHHENEIAQSESLTDKPFAKYWLHHGLTRFNTKKISKSDAEIQEAMKSLELAPLLEKHPPELLRFLILSSHYRAPIDFSQDTLEAAGRGLEKFYRLFERVERQSGNSPFAATVRTEHVRERATDDASRALVADILADQVRFLEAMDDDFNTAAAIGVLFDMTARINRYLEHAANDPQAQAAAAEMADAAAATLIFKGHILGLFENAPEKKTSGTLTDDLIGVLLDVRTQARAARHFEIADLVRTRLESLGIVLEDRAEGTTWRRR